MEKWLARIGISIGVLLFLLFLLLIKFIFWPEDLSKVQKEMIQYLENKYGQEFEVVKNVSWDFIENEFDLIACPKNDRRVTFEVHRTRGGHFWDYYPDRLWTVQINDELKPLLDQLYPPRNRWEFELDIFRSSAYYRRQLDKIDPKNIPDYSEVLKDPDLMELHLDIKYIKDLNESNKDEELEKAYRLIQIFREKGAKNCWIDISYFEERLREKKGKKKEEVDLSDYATHAIILIKDEVKTIHSPEDLEEHIIKDPGIF